MNDVQRFGRIQVEMCDTFKSKNADYGNSFSQLYQEFGDNGIITAAVRDTLLYLANYCVLTVMELDKAKEKANASSSSAFAQAASAVTYRTTPQFDYSKYISDGSILASGDAPAATLKGDAE